MSVNRGTNLDLIRRRRMRRGLLALPMAVLALASAGCRGAGQGTPRGHAEAQGATTGRSIGSTAIWIAADRRTAIADFDGSGHPDTLRVERVREGRVLATRISLHGSINAERKVSGDSYPQVVDLVDLNGDGLLDVLLDDVDESSVWTGVLLVGRASLRFATLDPSTPPRTMSFIWPSSEAREACMSAITPSVEHVPGAAPVITVAINGAESAASCMTPRHVKFRVVNDTIRAVN